MSGGALRGRCPSLLEPLETGDGLLARLPARERELGAWAGLCAAAHRHGNGELEITAQGSVQIRGVRPGASAALAGALRALGFGDEPGPSVLATPFGTRDPDAQLDAAALAAELRAALAELAAREPLHPRLAVCIESGGALHLDGRSADVRLRAAPRGLALLVGGDALGATSLGRVAPEAVAPAVRALVAQIARRGPRARARGVLQAEGEGPFRAALAAWLRPGERPRPRPPARVLGVHALAAGRFAVGVALPFGAARAERFAALVAAAERRGATSLQPWERHTALAIGLDAAAARALRADAARLGLATCDDEPARQISTCAGQPGCAAAQLATRPLAAALAARGGPLLDGSLAIHISGCSKRCGAPRSADLAITALGDACDVALRAGPLAARARWRAAELAATLERAGERLAKLCRPRESARAALARGALRGELGLEDAAP